MKTDIFKREMLYVYEGQYSEAPIVLNVDAVKEIINRNRQGIEVADVEEFIVHDIPVEKETDFAQVVGQDSLTRFDKTKRPNHRNKGRSGNNDRRPDNRRNPQGTPQNTDSRPERRENNNPRPPRPDQKRVQEQKPPRAPRPENGTPSERSSNDKQGGNRPPRENRPPRGPKPSPSGPTNPPTAS